jgi:hypothetical protein
MPQHSSHHLTPEEVTAIVEALNAQRAPDSGPWAIQTCVEHADIVYIGGPQEASLRLCTVWHDVRRLVITGNYATTPEHERLLGYNAPQPQITVARARGGPAIAKDISTRFLPKYWPLLQESQQRLNAVLQERAQVETYCAQLAQVPGCRTGPQRGAVHVSGQTAEGTRLDATFTVAADGTASGKVYRWPVAALIAHLTSLALQPPRPGG